MGLQLFLILLELNGCHYQFLVNNLFGIQNIQKLLVMQRENKLNSQVAQNNILIMPAASEEKLSDLNDPSMVSEDEQYEVTQNSMSMEEEITQKVKAQLESYKMQAIFYLDLIEKVISKNEEKFMKNELVQMRNQLNIFNESMTDIHTNLAEFKVYISDLVKYAKKIITYCQQNDQLA